jgi:competence protein ComEC
VAAWVGEYFLFTLAAQLTTLPIMAYHFKRISLIALIANPFILPVQPPVMIVSGLALLVSLIFLPLGQIVALAAWPFSAYTIRMVEFFHQLPNGVIVLGNASLWFVILFYAALLFWTLGRSRLTSLRLAVSPAAVLTSLALLTFLIWRQAFAAPDGKLHLTFLDVGSGDAILIQTPAGRNVLINGGPSPSLLSDGLGRRLPPLERRLDWLVVASTQEEQIAALPRVLERFPPRRVLWAGNAQASYAARSLDRWLTEQAVPVTQAEAGQILDLGQGAQIRVLSVGPRGAILLVEWGTLRVLLPCGLDFDQIEGLDSGRAVGPVSALLLAERGYAPANPPEWIRALNPQVVIISVAADDPYGQPDKATLENLSDYNLLRTDLNGWIHLSSDGQSLWLEVERGAMTPILDTPSLPQQVESTPRPEDFDLGLVGD